MNIVNFVRALDPRSPKANYIETLSNEVALVRQYGFPSTCLLQYDALVDAEMMSLARKFDSEKTEYGLWFEMSRPHNEAAGVEWRGKHDWEYFVNPGFLLAYTRDDRRRLIDAAFKKFKDEFGEWPKVAGSWMLDAWSMDYMVNTYGVDGFCICREQDSTDAYGLRGGYSNGAYYPSKRNMLSAAVDMANAVRAPVFKMLTPDPIYNYCWPHKLYKGYPCAGGCPTLEPRWYGGSSPKIMDWYFRVYTEPEGLLNLSYMQTGQENSFTWKRIEQGWKIQCPKIAEEAAAGRIVVEKFGDTARAFKAAHRQNCPQTQIALEDWTGAGRKSVWYNSRFYRANLVMEGKKLLFRDIHKMCDDFDEPFIDSPCFGWQALDYTPPVVDQWMFRSEGASGVMAFSGEFKSIKTAADGDSVLVATATRTDGSTVTVRFEEGRIAVSGGALSAEYEEKFRKSVFAADDGVDFEFQGYRYRMPVRGAVRATEKGFEIGGDRIELDLSADAPAVRAVRQVVQPERFQRGDTNVSRLQGIDEAHWIWHPAAPSEGKPGEYAFLRFEKKFRSDGSPLKFDVSGDERFILMIDGKPVSFGPHRGMVDNWLYQTYEVELTSGMHEMAAVVWVLGPYAPSAQLSYRGGFVLKAYGVYDKELTTGTAKWRVARLKNTKMLDRGMRGAYGIGADCEVRGCSLLDERPSESDSVEAKSVRGAVWPNVCGLRTRGWMLFPTPLPDQMHEYRTPGEFKAARASFDRSKVYLEKDARHPALPALNALLKEGRAMTIPTNTIFCALLDLGNYYCAYPELETAGGKGSEIRWMWAESLRIDSKVRHKGNRDEFIGKLMSDTCDRFFPDGRADARFTVPWWRTGRWCQFEIKTGSEPLVLNRIRIAESRYPVRVIGSFRCDDDTLDYAQHVCLRGIEMAMHENMCDGPHYEQQQYIGDTLTQNAALAAIDSDDRLVRRALSLFDYARRDNGMLPMNFPTVGTQESTTYTMLWAIALDDYRMWHDNAAWLKARFPGLCHTTVALSAFENEDGLLRHPPGWSFMDWVPKWGAGIAPDGSSGVSSLNNLFYVLSLQSAANVAETVGEGAYAAIWRAKAEAIGRKIVERFWMPERGILADTLKKDRFSEHTQCLAIFAGILSKEQEDAAMAALERGEGLERTTDYFSHYLFRAYAKKGRGDLILKRMDFWRKHKAYGLHTPLEDDDFDAKSDCHAWAAHPLFHLHAAIAGVTPAEPFFKTVRVAPQPGGLKWINAVTPHPKGVVATNLRFEGNFAEGEVSLPDGVSGEFCWKGRTLPLHGGVNKVSVK